MYHIEQILKKIPQYTRNSRHLWSVIRHGDLRKWANLVQTEFERKMRIINMKGHPYLLIIDPCNYCNLRCPLCPTGVNDLGRRQTMLSFDNFKKYFDTFSSYLFEVYLHNWGESLLNKQVYKMIEYAQSRNVGTNLSSNFSEVDSDDISYILDSGLEYLVVSLDGTSHESYAKYRIRGNYDRVVSNLNELVRRRKGRRKKTPVIEWQFIVMKQNEHQIPEAEILAKQIGVDLLRFIPAGIPIEFTDRREIADKWFSTTIHHNDMGKENPEKKRIKEVRKHGPCFYLYRSVVVNSDGGVSPCCEVYRKNRDFADLNISDIDVMEMWNNEMYHSGRSLYSSKTIVDKVMTICDECNIFEKHISKKKQMSSDVKKIIA